MGTAWESGGSRSALRSPDDRAVCAAPATDPPTATEHHVSVLLVEDEPSIRSLVCRQLRDQGLHVTAAATVAEAEAALSLRTYVVIILDLTLPDGSGLDVLDRLHASDSSSHVIILSGSTAEADRVRALQRGADDFVVKPFYMRELTARVLAVGRRRDPVADRTLRIGHLDIDLLSRVVTSAGRSIELTAKEFDLLAYLAVRPGHVFDREQLLNAVWQSTGEWQQAATVTEHIRRLRVKLEVDPAHPTLLTTVRGAGYRLDLPTAPGGGTTGLGQASDVDVGEIVHVDGLIVSCDEAAAHLIGAPTPAGVVGTSVVELITATSPAAARGRFIESGAGPTRRSELMQLRQGDGGAVTAAVESTPAEWQGQPARRLLLTPVTDARARLRQLVTGVLGDLTDAVVITDLHFHIRSWNSAAERLYGWSEEDVRGRHVVDVLHWVGDDDQLPEMWDRLEHTGRWHGESRQRTRDGSVVDVLSSTTLVRDEVGEPVGIVSVNRTAVDARRTRSLERDATLATRLREALSDGEFQVHYQPVVDLSDGRLVTLEALVRWQHPERGLLLPAEFLDTAERSGLIVELGEFVLDTACRQAARWRRAGADVHVSVNVSTRQLADPSMVQRSTSIIRNSGLDPAFLWLEVTETAVVEGLETASHVLRDLVDLGVGVAIDDFGTGWASLTYLQQLPVHAIKIDRSFVAGVGRRANDTAIVKSILSLGAELDLYVVAEGIETQDHHDAVTRLGCAFGQGHLFGRPTAAHDVPVERARRISTGARATAGGPVPAVLGMVSAAAATSSGEPGRRGRTLEPPQPAGGRVRLSPPSSGPGRRATIADEADSDVVANLLRGLLRVRSAPAAAELLDRTIRGMGGVPVPAADADDTALPIDVSLGEGPPTLVEVERFTVARMQMERLLPRLVEDARQAVDLLRHTERLAGESARDQLTGLANRRVLDRVLPRASGTVVMIDLDHFKDVNDRHGHAAGDAVLTSFADALMVHVRAQDTSCRIGGDEFALVLEEADPRGAVVTLDRLRHGWSGAAPHAVTFSAGVAAVGADGGTAALLSADRALYRAKALGRDRIEMAAPRAEPEVE